MKETKYACREIRSLDHVIKRYFEQHCRQNRELVDRISGTNGWLIGFIAHHSRSGRDVYQRDLEEAFSLPRSTVSQTVDLLVQKGLLARCPVEHDARLKRLQLTEDAAALADMMEADMQHVESQLTEGFSAEELTQLFSYLKRMKNNLGGKDK